MHSSVVVSYPGGPDVDTDMVCAGVLRAIAQAGGAALWANGGKPYEEALALCVAYLDDASRTGGDAARDALGAFVAAAKSPAATAAVRCSSTCWSAVVKISQLCPHC